MSNTPKLAAVLGDFVFVEDWGVEDLDVEEEVEGKEEHFEKERDRSCFYKLLYFIL